jgi:hypothetical protein
MKKNLFNSLTNGILALGLVMFLFSCNKEEIYTHEPINETVLELIEITPRLFLKSSLTDNACGIVTTAALMAGQTLEVGTVTAYNDEENFYITITIDKDDWFIRKTHLYVGERTSTEGIRNPAPGKFPYFNDVVSENNTGIQIYSYVIEKGEENINFLKNWGEFDIALHADLVRVAIDENGNPILNEDNKASVLQYEGAWAAGERFTLKGSWATYFSYSWQSCEDVCDPTWAKNVTVESNGDAYLEIEYTLSNKGIRVGEVKVLRTGGASNRKIKVTFDIDEDFEDEFDFNKIGIHYSTSLLEEVDKSLFVGGHNLSGNTIILTQQVNKKWEYEFENVSSSAYLTLFADIKGACPVD